MKIGDRLCKAKAYLTKMAFLTHIIFEMSTHNRITTESKKSEG